MSVFKKSYLVFISLLIINCSKDSDVVTDSYSSNYTSSTSSDYSSSTTNTTSSVTQYTLTVTAAEGGNVSTSGGTYDNGTSISITATPNEGYEFTGWSGTNMSNSTITFTINSNTTLEALFSQISQTTSGENINFIYNLHESLPSGYISEFNTIMDNLIATIPATQQTWLINPDLNIYAWNNSVNSPYTDPNGNAMQGASISGNGSSFWMILEIPADEFTYNSMHRYSVIAHEYFHVYQMSLSENFAAPSNDPNGFSILWLSEGTAVNFESLYIQQYYGYNYYDDFTSGADFTQVITNPAAYESRDVGDMNYSGSGFMILALVSELKKIGFSEEKAFQSVFKTFWESNPNDTNWKTKFEEVFTITVDTFYQSLASYSTDVSLIYPQSSLTLQNIINDTSSIGDTSSTNSNSSDTTSSDTTSSDTTSADTSSSDTSSSDTTSSDTTSSNIWSGAMVQFSKEDGADFSQESNQDRITSNVWITRGNAGQIFNIAKENSAVKADSPVRTLWAKGNIDNIDNLTFEPFRQAVGQPKTVVGLDLVLYLVDDDIYLSVKFTSWSQGQKGGFAYERSSE
ncbi:MAG: hypothetical protein EVA41_04890 [Flavobacteriales bacterium]|nr:MAG: hypothetical protein EVA41_04890 [Flavobacteriales bacterium]